MIFAENAPPFLRYGLGPQGENPGPDLCSFQQSFRPKREDLEGGPLPLVQNMKIRAMYLSTRCSAFKHSEVIFNKNTSRWWKCRSNQQTNLCTRNRKESYSHWHARMEADQREQPERKEGKANWMAWHKPQRDSLHCIWLKTRTAGTTKHRSIDTFMIRKIRNNVLHLEQRLQAEDEPRAFYLYS